MAIPTTAPTSTCATKSKPRSKPPRPKRKPWRRSGPRRRPKELTASRIPKPIRATTIPKADLPATTKSPTVARPRAAPVAGVAADAGEAPVHRATNSRAPSTTARRATACGSTPPSRTLPPTGTAGPASAM